MPNLASATFGFFLVLPLGITHVNSYALPRSRLASAPSELCEVAAYKTQEYTLHALSCVSNRPTEPDQTCSACDAEARCSRLPGRSPKVSGAVAVQSEALHEVLHLAVGTSGQNSARISYILALGLAKPREHALFHTLLRPDYTRRSSDRARATI